MPIVDSKSDVRAALVSGAGGAERAGTELGAGDFASDRDNNTLRAYREIRRRVLDGEMAPGTQYLEQELAEMLGMSRTPVREALIRLADERLVEVRPRHGARVLNVSIDDVGEIYELLAELEAAAARRLALRGASAEVLAKLDAAERQMTSELKSGNRLGWFDGDRRFHAALVEAGGNKRLATIVRGLTDQSHWARLQTIPHDEITVGSTDDHVDIIRAIRTRDAEAAHRLLHAHRVRGGKSLVSLMERRGTGHA